MIQEYRVQEFVIQGSVMQGFMLYFRVCTVITILRVLTTVDQTPSACLVQGIVSSNAMVTDSGSSTCGP